MTRVMLDKPRDLFLSSYFAARRFVIDEVIRYEYAYPYVIGLVLRTTKKIINGKGLVEGLADNIDAVGFILGSHAHTVQIDASGQYLAVIVVCVVAADFRTSGG